MLIWGSKLETLNLENEAEFDLIMINLTLPLPLQEFTCKVSRFKFITSCIHAKKHVQTGIAMGDG